MFFHFVFRINIFEVQNCFLFEFFGCFDWWVLEECFGLGRKLVVYEFCVTWDVLVKKLSGIEIRRKRRYGKKINVGFDQLRIGSWSGWFWSQIFLFAIKMKDKEENNNRTTIEIPLKDSDEVFFIFCFCLLLSWKMLDFSTVLKFLGILNF